MEDEHAESFPPRDLHMPNATYANGKEKRRYHPLSMQVVGGEKMRGGLTNNKTIANNRNNCSSRIPAANFKAEHANVYPFQRSTRSAKSPPQE
jgi:hypothetical protein